MTLDPSEVKKPNRPQTPQPPYPYETEDLTFENKAEGFSLAGTLTYPKDKKKLPAVILLTGSGAQNRDEELFEHKPFHVIADHLTRQGIAVLRFDDRGFGESGGDILNATTQSFATDAQSAINYLKTRPEIDSKKIGLIGHSEGGNVAFITAGMNQKDVAFVVSLAAMGETGKQTLMRQNEVLSKARGMSDQDWQKRAIALQNEYALLMQDKTIEELKADAQADALKKIPEEMRTNPETLRKVETAINNQITPWLVNFIKYDPSIDLAKVKCPVLALNGDKDTQVEANTNTSIIASTLTKAGNKKAEAKIYPSLNHFFQTAKTGMVSEYGEIEETIDPQVLNDITLWIKKKK